MRTFNNKTALSKFAALIIVFLLVLAAGCNTPNGKAPGQSGTAQQNASQQNTKVRSVQFDTSPEGATVYVDGKAACETPCKQNLTIGTHKIMIFKEGFRIYSGDFLVKENAAGLIKFYLKLSKKPINPGEIISFYSVPIIPNRENENAFSGIFVNQTAQVSGETILKEFDLVFPSGKKVHFETTETPIEYESSVHIRVFSKSVTFNELGTYTISVKGNTAYFATSKNIPYQFTVLYRAYCLNFPRANYFTAAAENNVPYEAAVILPIDKQVNLELHLVDAKGNDIKNKLIGMGNYKTDENGNVIVPVEAKKEAPTLFYIYSNLYGWRSCYSVFDKNGNLLDARFARVDSKGILETYTPDWLPRKTRVITKDGDTFMPFDCSGLTLSDLGLSGYADKFIANTKNPQVIYTSGAVSKDGGKTFTNYQDNILFSEIAVCESHSNVVYGWDERNKMLLKSTDFGAHFEEIGDFETVTHIAVDPKNPQRVFVTTDKELLLTTDGGKTWKPLMNCAAFAWISPLNPDTIFVTNCNFRKSANGGKTWSDNINVFKKNPAYWNVPVAVMFDSKDKNAVYAVTYTHLFKSADGGKTWEMPTEKCFDTIFNAAINPKNPSEIYLATRDGILKSSDKGKHFQRISNPAPVPNARMNLRVAISKNGDLYGIFSGIPFKWVNGEWVLLNKAFITSVTPLDSWIMVIKGKLYVNVNKVDTPTSATQIRDGKIIFYRLCEGEPR